MKNLFASKISEYSSEIVVDVGVFVENRRCEAVLSRNQDSIYKSV